MTWRARGGRLADRLGGDLAGATLGVVGLGNLGAYVARIGTAFGMNVVAWSENLTEQRCAEVGADGAPVRVLARQPT